MQAAKGGKPQKHQGGKAKEPEKASGPRVSAVKEGCF